MNVNINQNISTHLIGKTPQLNLMRFHMLRPTWVIIKMSYVMRVIIKGLQHM